MLKENAFLFDLDGVIIDTESQYNVFWKEIAKTYHIEVENFEYIIKGSTLANILHKYFSHLTVEEQNRIAQLNADFNFHMDISPIPGVLEFLQQLQENHLKTALVTSSDDEKLNYVFSKISINLYFDTIVSADRILKGKPDPQCYLLAAQDLKVSPSNCFVFEDSFNGIESGINAGMKVIGLSTTNPVDSIQDLCVKVIPDFKHIKLSQFF